MLFRSHPHRVSGADLPEPGRRQRPAALTRANVGCCPFVAEFDRMIDTPSENELRVMREVLDDLNLAAIHAFGAHAFFGFDLDASGLIPADLGGASSTIGERRTAVDEVRATIESMATGASGDERAVLEEAWARIVPILGGLGSDAHVTPTPDATTGSNDAERATA